MHQSELPALTNIRIKKIESNLYFEQEKKFSPTFLSKKVIFDKLNDKFYIFTIIN